MDRDRKRPLSVSQMRAILASDKFYETSSSSDSDDNSVVILDTPKPKPKPKAVEESEDEDTDDFISSDDEVPVRKTFGQMKKPVLSANNSGPSSANATPSSSVNKPAVKKRATLIPVGDSLPKKKKLSSNEREIPASNQGYKADSVSGDEENPAAEAGRNELDDSDSSDSSSDDTF